MPDTEPRPPPANEVDAPSVHAAVDRIVLAHGAYLPIELLLDHGRLEYRAYEAWRTGAEEFLEDVLLGNPARIRGLLREAAAWAGRLGLVAGPEAHAGWGPRAGARIAGARDRELEELLGTPYRRRPDAVQPDLFLDGGDAVPLSDLRRALAARDAPRAASQLERLLRRAPDHRLRPASERLCDALAHLADGGPLGDPALELERLRGQLAIDARELLGEQARDYAAPLWRRLANALAGHPFDSAVPELHASFAHRQCFDWSAIRAGVLATPGFANEPVLLVRLAEAERRLGERIAAVGWLAELCWRWPDAAEAELDGAGIGDPAVQAAWKGFRDFDADPVMDAAWLPAWLLIAEPGLARALELLPPDSAGSAGVGFIALRDLIRHREAGLDEAAISRRRRLRDAHPDLLAEYLRRQDRGGERS